MTAPYLTDLQRFEDGYVPEPNTGCWLWVKGLSYGYGQMFSRIGTKLAHRVGYLLLRGEIPEGMDLDHLCRTTSCVNPWHLEAVSHAENLRRGVGFPGRLARMQVCDKGHTEWATKVWRGKSYRYCRPCAYDRAKTYLDRKRIEESVKEGLVETEKK